MGSEMCIRDSARPVAHQHGAQHDSARSRLLRRRIDGRRVDWLVRWRLRHLRRSWNPVLQPVLESRNDAARSNRILDPPCRCGRKHLVLPRSLDGGRGSPAGSRDAVTGQRHRAADLTSTRSCPSAPAEAEIAAERWAPTANETPQTGPGMSGRSSDFEGWSHQDGRSWVVNPEGPSYLP